MPRQKKNQVAFTLRDWKGREVVAPRSLLTIHLPRCHADPEESTFYVETLKDRFQCPDKVLSRSRQNELEFIVNLEGRRHKYLVIYVKYSRKLSKLVGYKNFISTIYGTNEERNGEIVWQPNSKDQKSSTTKQQT